MTAPDDDEPLLNRAIGDLLAHCATPADFHVALDAWLRLGAEVMARECGRSACMNKLHELRSHIRDTEPTRSWPP